MPPTPEPIPLRWDPPDLLALGRMSEEEIVVFRVLYPAHVGRAKSIDRDELVDLVRTPDRQLRAILEALKSRGIPVCSAVAPPYGYFIARTEDELAGAVRLMRRYGISALVTAKRLGDILSVARRREIQCELPFPPEILATR